jgi:uncharacterized repeat protein (TIGR01451 family)
MKIKLFTFVLSLLAVATFGVSQIQADAAVPGKVGDAPRCDVVAVGERASAFNLGANPAPVTFKVTGGKNCKVRLSTGSFYAPSMDGKPYNKQILFHRNIRVFDTPGTYTMVAPIPTSSTPAQGCYYQVDLSYGTVVNTPVIAYGHGKIPGCGDVPVQVKDIAVCRLSDKVYPVTIKEDQFNATLYSKNPEDCKPAPAPKPGLSITKYVNGVKHDTVEVNEQFSYKLTITNTGDVELKNASVSDPTPEGVQFIGADKGTVSGIKWSYTIPSLPVGQSVSVTIQAKVTKQMSGAIKNTACVAVPEVNSNTPACDSATVDVPMPGKTEVCDAASGTIITVDENNASNYEPKNSDKCKKVEPAVSPKAEPLPQDLPQTGPIDTALQVVGATTLASASSYYFVSRRRS